jgi:hypothetical protein
MEHVLAHVEVLVLFAMQVCQQPSMFPLQEGSMVGIPESPEGAASKPTPASATMGSFGQKLCALARKQASALSVHTPSIQAAPRKAWLPKSHEQHDGRHWENVEQLLPAAPVPESSAGVAGQLPLRCSPLAEMVLGPPLGEPVVEELEPAEQANTSAATKQVAAA